MKFTFLCHFKMKGIAYSAIFLLAAYFEVVNSFLVPDGLHSVRTKVGEIIGFNDQVTFDGRAYQVKKFLGIPYAEPPIGNLRFRKPVMKSNLTSPFHAMSYGSICLQPYYTQFNRSEDCLFLNIFAPDNSGISSRSLLKKPVMIWIHGGGFIVGMADIYKADVISAFGDVIVVTINYRLGFLGFFSTHDPNAPGNYGLWDQHLAIRWVKENIEAFGGDVSNITIFGESAGSSSVIYQMLYSGNKGLFQRAIAESGTVSAWGISHGDTNYESSREYARILDCNSTANAKLLACLRQLPERDMLAIVEREYPLNEVNRSWVPVFDDEFVQGKTADILAELQNETLSRTKYPNFQNVDLLIGANSFDGSVYYNLIMRNLYNNLIPDYLTKEQFENVIVERSLRAWLGEAPTALAKKLTVNEYTNWDEPDSVSKRLRNAFDIFSDYALFAPTISTVNAHDNNSTRTYLYRFAASPPKHITHIPSEIDNDEVACHADEMFYVFGFGFITDVWKEYFSPEALSPKDIKLAKAMITMWTNFAKSGNPNTPRDLRNVYDVRWPEYDAREGKYLEITHGPSSEPIKTGFAARGVEFWNNLLPAIQTFAKSRETLHGH